MCVSLSSNECVECISFLLKYSNPTFKSSILYINVYSLLLQWVCWLTAACSIFGLLPPPVDHWDSVKPPLACTTPVHPVQVSQGRAHFLVCGCFTKNNTQTSVQKKANILRICSRVLSFDSITLKSQFLNQGNHFLSYSACFRLDIIFDDFTESLSSLEISDATTVYELDSVHQCLTCCP